MASLILNINIKNPKKKFPFKICWNFVISLHCPGGLNYLPYLLSIAVSMVVIKDFSTNYMKALEMNQANILLKLRNNYYIVLICSYGWKREIYYSYKQKVYTFFLYLDKTDDFCSIRKTIWILKTIKVIFK